MEGYPPTNVEVKMESTSTMMSVNGAMELELKEELPQKVNKRKIETDLKIDLTKGTSSRGYQEEDREPLGGVKEASHRSASDLLCELDGTLITYRRNRNDQLISLSMAYASLSLSLKKLGSFGC